MSLIHSPQIVTSGLVFYYDMNNTQKSWRGMTATNLVSVPTKEVLGTSNEFLQWGDIAPVFDTYGTGTGYSLSLDLKSKVPGNILVYMQNGTTTKYSFVNQNVTATTAYQRFTFNNLSAAIFDAGQTQAQLAFYGVYGSGRVPSVKNVQIEKNIFATPFVNGTRSNTQAIVDLTGNNTITASSLTYNSNNTFSFDGTSNYISSTFATTSGQAVTYCGWLYSTETTSTYRNFVDSVTARPMIWWNTSGQIEFDAAYYTTTAVYRNQWVYVVLSKPAGSSSASYYVNGVLVGTGTAYTTPAVTPTWFNRGGSQTWKGDSSIVNVYNRALSSAEVLQNFNALKGRYGL